MPKNRKVSIVAIAKDEAAYLSDWVHHHLYFGFDSIYIGMNRVSDESHVLMEKISDKYPNVHAFNMDWIDKGCDLDKNPQMQSLSYAFLTQKILDVENVCTDLLYIDIDEFWFPADFSSSINSYLNFMPSFDIISFNWLEQSGDEYLFSPPFKNLGFSQSKHVKSLINSGICKYISNYRCHAPKISDSPKNIVHLNAQGDKFQTGKHNGISAKKGELGQKAYILHRLYRSEKEYVALLRRERPGLALPIKDNRQGFVSSVGKHFEVDPEKLERYWLSLSEFIDSCDLSLVLDSSRDALLLKAENILEVDLVVLVNHAEIYKRVLKGTYMYERLLERLDEAEVWVKNVEPESLDINSVVSNALYYTQSWSSDKRRLKQMIKILEQHDDVALKHKNGPIFLKCADHLQCLRFYDLAFRLISLAKLCRPEGPHILRKYDEIKLELEASTTLRKIRKAIGV